MSFYFEIERPQPIGLVRVEIRNPEFGDSYSLDRRQAAGETEGGKLFVQDLGTEERYYEGTWTNLTAEERRRIEYFFGYEVANKRMRRFTFGVFDNARIPVRVGTDQGCGTGDGLTTGQFKCPSTASFGQARLEQSAIQFSAIPPDRYTVSLRFRLLSQTVC